MVCKEGIHIFTDHKNLLFAFHPLSVEPTVARHKISKVARWALFMSTFHYVIEHVAVESNVFPDMLTRLMKGYRSTNTTICRVRSRVPYSGVPVSPLSKSFEWPTRGDIINAQQFAVPPPNATKTLHGLYQVSGKIWIPAQVDSLKLRLFSIAHAGETGHRGMESTFDSLQSTFSWSGMSSETKEFVNDCLLCLISKSGNRIPRPLSTGIHSTRPGEILHFDFIYLGPSTSTDKYSLVLKDYFSSYCWIEPVDSANAENAALILAKWNRVFTAPSIWVSDQGPQFINSAMDLLATDYHILHKPVVAYSTWANGTVEALMRTILAAFRAMLLELKLAPQNWKDIVHAIPVVLNGARLERLGRNEDGRLRSPLQVMTGILPNRSIARIVPNDAPTNTSHTLSDAHAQQLIEIGKFQSLLDQMHKAVSEKISARRRKSIASHNKATNISEPHFEIGDIVILRRAVDRGHKLLNKWRGPMRVEKIHSPLVYSVSHFDGSGSIRVHATRLIRYCAALKNNVVPSDVLALADQTSSTFETIDRFTDIAEDHDKSIMVRVCWDGLPDERDSTWHKLTDMYEDVPDLLTSFLNEASKGHKTVLVNNSQLLLNIL